MAKKTGNEDYFTSAEFARCCDARSKESFNIISGSEAKAIHENYLKALSQYLVDFQQQLQKLSYMAKLQHRSTQLRPT